MLTADEVLSVVRVHADRVHDAVRRLGCGPEAAVRVVETSARELVETAARQPETVDDPVGWWFARARSLGRRAAGGDDALPVGSGVLAGDDHQVRLAEALESLPERERAALLLRDSYDLPADAVAAALGLDADNAMEVVGQARLDFLPRLTEVRAERRGEHPSTLAPLARLAEGGHTGAREAGTRRHAQGCDTCAALLDTQERSRRLLAGLTVVALSEADRERLLADTAGRASALLPEAVVTWEDDEDEPHRHYSLSLMALGLLVASGLGIGVGLLASKGSAGVPFVTPGTLPVVTAAPVLRVGPTTALPITTRGPSPSPRVFVVTPSPTPTPSATATPTATATATALALQLDPSSGPHDSQITVTGQGWTPGAAVTVSYLNSVGSAAGATSQVVVAGDGTFTTTIVAHDSGLGAAAGPHQVTADDGTHHDTATFTAT